MKKLLLIPVLLVITQTISFAQEFKKMPKKEFKKHDKRIRLRTISFMVTLGPKDAYNPNDVQAVFAGLNTSSSSTALYKLYSFTRNSGGEATNLKSMRVKKISAVKATTQQPPLYMTTNDYIVTMSYTPPTGANTNVNDLMVYWLWPTTTVDKFKAFHPAGNFHWSGSSSTPAGTSVRINNEQAFRESVNVSFGMPAYYPPSTLFQVVKSSRQNNYYSNCNFGF